MGYILKDIATIKEPARISLSGLPNFIQLSSKTTGGTAFQARIVPVSTSYISITIQDSQSGIRNLVSTTEPANVEGSVFYLSTDILETTENIKAALLTDSYIAANFDVYSDIIWNSGTPTVNGVVLKAKEIGSEFNLTIAGSGATITFIATGASSDSIKGNAPVVEISVDMYRESTTAPIHTQPPSGSLGKPIITLTKSYNGLPIWFDLNGVAAQNINYLAPTGALNTWFDTGTLTAYRGLVRKSGYNNTPIYATEILYAISGYGELIDTLNFAEYVYTAAPIKTLTERPVVPYMKGQREYITFLLGAALTGKQISILQRAYTGTGVYIGSVTKAAVATSQLHAINSCAFDFTDLLTSYPDTVKLTATLSMGGALISEPLVYEVRPECLHTLNQFYFINRLGGWDTFNFDGPTVEDVKPNIETYNKTVTPAYTKAEGVEGVYLADLDQDFTIQGAPITYEVAEWLRQLVASKVIIDMEGRRIVIDEFTLKPQAGEYMTPVIKYRLSETFTNGY